MLFKLQMMAFVGLVGGAHPAHAEGLFERGQTLEILARERACATAAGAVCWSSPARVDVSGEPTAAVGLRGGVEEARFTLRRIEDGAGGDPSWSVEVDAHLRRRALAGNALFILYDLEDPGAIERREVTALWQGAVASGDWVAAKLLFTADDGFRPEHSYRLRIAQLLNSHEVVLAEGELRLR